MIKRITSLNELKVLYNSFDQSAVEKSGAALHYGGEPYNKDLLFKVWNNVSLLLNETLIVANFDKPDHIDAFIFFVIGPDYRVGKNIAQSYIWLSLSPLMGVKVFLEAENILKQRKDVDYIMMGVLRSSSVSGKFEDVLCNRFGYSPEGKSFFKKLTH